MVSKSHKDRVVPLPNGRNLWLINGGYYLLTIPGMILQVGPGRVLKMTPVLKGQDTFSWNDHLFSFDPTYQSMERRHHS